MYDWSKYNKWKICPMQNITSLNLSTHHTFNVLFDHLKVYLKDITTNLFDVNLRDIEIPQADASWTRTNITPKRMLDSSYLPRAILMYNIDVNQEALVSIPSMDRINRANIGMNYKCFSIKQPRLSMPDGQWFDYMKDIDMSLIGMPKYSTASIFWSVLVNEQPLAIDLVKQFKYHFPIGETNPIFNGFVQVNPPYGPKIEKPYQLEAFIPRKIVDDLLNIFQINDTMLLSKILKMHSDNRIEYKIHSGASDETYADLAVAYASPVYLTPSSIDLIENNENNVKYYGVKIEFIVNYIDLTSFRLHHTMLAINKEHPLLQVKNPTVHITDNGDVVGYGKVNEANFTQLIKGTTIWDYFKVIYSEEDIDNVYDETTDRNKECMVVNIYDIVQAFTIRKYINYIIKSQCNLNREEFFNIEVKRTKRGKDDEWVVGTEDEFEIDYDNLNIIDYRSKPDDSVYVAIYINKEHYNKWLQRQGYTNQSNLTSL